MPHVIKEFDINCLGMLVIEEQSQSLMSLNSGPLIHYYHEELSLSLFFHAEPPATQGIFF